MVDISIWITTYNHEKYIAEAIESVLRQETTFTYELVIGEDCSTDRTREIVLAYKAQYPDKIKLLLPDKNLGMIPMYKATYSLCTGKYVAWLDGDDYWTDPFKLQKQVGFLADNPDYVLCFHNVEVLDQLKNITYAAGGPTYKYPDDTLSYEHFLQPNHINPISAPSVVYRNVLGPYLPDWYFDLPYPDLGLYFLMLEHGKFKYLNEIMCVYRIHKGGAWSGETLYNNVQQIATFCKILIQHTNNPNNERIHKIIGDYSYALLEWDLKSYKYRAATTHLKDVVTHDIGLLKSHLPKLLYLTGISFIKSPKQILKKMRPKQKKV